jgi:HK97 gp10 family phage protein
MADKEKFEIEGLKDIQKALDKLPTKIKGKVLRRANRMQANKVKKAVKAAAPENTKSSKISFKRVKSGKNKGKRRVVKHSIKANIKTASDRSNLSGVLVGIDKIAFQARFIEYGTKNRKTKGKGKYRAGAGRGSVKAKPFFMPTVDRMIPKIIKELNTSYGDIISESLRKQSKLIKRK